MPVPPSLSDSQSITGVESILKLFVKLQIKPLLLGSSSTLFWMVLSGR